MKIKSLAGALLFSAFMMLSCSGKNAQPKEVRGHDATEFETVDDAVAVTNNATSIVPDATLPVVIDFNATWCGPCRRFAPIFEEVAREYKGKAKFLSVNVDNSPQLARQFGVSSIPQVSVLLPDGTVRSTIGFMEKEQFVNFLETATRR